MESKEAWFFRNSQSRYLRRKMAKTLGFMKYGWQAVKEEFPPYNKPMNLGIKEFKRSLKDTALSPGDKRKAVVQYKLKAREAFTKGINRRERDNGKKTK